MRDKTPEPLEKPSAESVENSPSEEIAEQRAESEDDDNKYEAEKNDDELGDDVEIEEGLGEQEKLSLKDLSVNSRPHKQPFRLKKNTNGNILTIHHTVCEKNKLIRVRLGNCCFGERNPNQIVAIDKRGNIFVFDLVSKRFWKLSLMVLKANVVVASKYHENEYLIGTKIGQLLLIDVERSLVLRAAQVNESAILEISFPAHQLQPAPLALLHIGSEAIIVNLSTFKATHCLDFDEGRLSLKFACYIPQSEQIFTCFSNDDIHIWSGVTLKAVHIVHAIKDRNQRLRLTNAEECLPEFKLRDECKDGFPLESCETQNFSDGLISAYCFTTQGSGTLALATRDKHLLLLNLHTFALQQIFLLRDFVIKKCAFLPQVNRTHILALTTHGKLILLDCQATEFKLIIHVCATNMSLSPDGKLLAVLTKSGEAEIWTTSCLSNTLMSQQQCITMLKEAFKQPKPVTIAGSRECLSEDVKKLLTRDRLICILKEYGCYPAKYRTLIWCALLRLPCNRREFQQLLKLGIPSNIQQRADKLRIKNETLKRALIKIWSCLAHWCKALAYSDFYPYLILPFVKTFPRNSLVCFEICVTLLLNHFQLWFEYHPMPPNDYLGMCGNLLQYFDVNLSRFYVQHDITAKVYAWSVLSSCFSQVLDDEQWLILIDNVLSCPVYFPIFCTVAYNMLQREVILLLPDKVTIEHFFHEQNPIDVCKLVTKALKLMKNCPTARNPARYFQDFRPIPKHVYPKFLRYPREWVAQHEDEVKLLQCEQQAIDARIRQLELDEYKMVAQLEEGLKKEEHAKRLKEMETVYHEALRREEERVACQRKLLLLYQKEIRGYKGKVMATLRESDRRRRALELEQELDVLMNNIERERRRNDSAMILAEDEIRNHNIELLAQQQFLEQQYSPPTLAAKFRNDIRRLASERTLLRQHLMASTISPQYLQYDEDQPTAQSRVINLEEIERKLDDIQSEFMRITKD